MQEHLHPWENGTKRGYPHPTTRSTVNDSSVTEVTIQAVAQDSWQGAFDNAQGTRRTLLRTTCSWYADLGVNPGAFSRCCVAGQQKHLALPAYKGVL